MGHRIANLWYQGVVFSPVSFNGDLLSKPEQAYEELPEEESISRGVMAKLKEILDPFKLIFHGEVVSSLEILPDSVLFRPSNDIHGNLSCR